MCGETPTRKRNEKVLQIQDETTNNLQKTRKENETKLEQIYGLRAPGSSLAA